MMASKSFPPYSYINTEETYSTTFRLWIIHVFEF